MTFTDNNDSNGQTKAATVPVLLFVRGLMVEETDAGQQWFWKMAREVIENNIVTKAKIYKEAEEKEEIFAIFEKIANEAVRKDVTLESDGQRDIIQFLETAASRLDDLGDDTGRVGAETALEAWTTLAACEYDHHSHHSRKTLQKISSSKAVHSASIGALDDTVSKAKAMSSAKSNMANRERDALAKANARSQMASGDSSKTPAVGRSAQSNLARMEQDLFIKARAMVGKVTKGNKQKDTKKANYSKIEMNDFDADEGLGFEQPTVTTPSTAKENAMMVTEHEYGPPGMVNLSESQALNPKMVKEEALPNDCLAVALMVPNDDIEDELIAVEAQQVDPNAVFYKNERFQLYSGAIIAFIAVIAIVVSVSAAKTVVDVTAEAVPTLLPTFSPTDFPTSTRYMKGFDKMIFPVSGNNIYDRSSAQGQALLWIIDNDKLKMEVTDSRLVQRYILALLYFSTVEIGKVDKWCYCGYNSTEDEYYNCYKIDSCANAVVPFLDEADECEWHGVTCVKNKVSEIDLRQSKLYGTMPHELSQLQSLRVLNLADNIIRGTIPKSLGKMQHLGDLALHYNFLTGTIPDDIYGLSSLQALDLGYNALSGTISRLIGDLTYVKALRLYQNFFTGPLPVELGNLKNLNFLWFHENDFTGTIPSGIWNNPKLKEFWGGFNLQTGSIPTSVNKMVDLTMLRLDDDSFSGSIPEELWDLTKLSWLYLNENNFSGTISTRIGQMKKLKRLSLKNNKLTGTIPSEMGKLVDLEMAWLYWNDLSGNVTKEVCALSKLENENNKLDIHTDCSEGSNNEPKVVCDCCTACCKDTYGAKECHKVFWK